MRWDRLFDDLEAQAEALAGAELVAEVAERSRGEYGRVRLVERLRPTTGHPLRLTVLGAGELAGTLERLGPDWLLLRESPDRELLVHLRALTTVSGLSVHTAAAAPGPVESRLDLRIALRGVARDRSGVAVTLVDGAILRGTLDRVGADFVELAEHPPGEPRRAGRISAVRTVPLDALAALQRT